VSLEDELALALTQLERAGLLRTPVTIEGLQGPELTIDGRRVVCFSSNNYLGLAGDERITRAIADGLECGTGAGASRLISGTMAAHRAAETKLAWLVGAEAALLFASGYAANLGAIGALAGPEDAVFSDTLNHASLIDGARLSRAQVHVYRHADIDHLRSLLASHRARIRRAIVITDGVFSMDGDIAPLRELRELCDSFDAALYVDEAHSLGVLGPEGRGICAALGVRADVLIGTLGKAFGLSGAFVAGSAALVAWLENRARSFVFSTGVPPYLAAAVVATVDHVVAAGDRRRRLAEHANRIRSGLAALGAPVLVGETPIIPVVLGASVSTMKLAATLFEKYGVFIPGIRPPTVPEGQSRLRIVPMATHERGHIDVLLDAWRKLG